VENPPRRDVVTFLRPAAPDPAAAGDAPPAPAALAVDARDEAPPLFRAPEPVSTCAAQAPTPAFPRPVGAAKAFTVEPLDGESVRLHVTISRQALAKLEAARDARPDASIAELLEAGLDLLLRQHLKRKGLVEKPRKEPPRSSPESAHIPAHVKRAVWLRDGGRCQFRMADGSVCGSTFRLELDHIRPRALGGQATVENTRVACRPHNQLAARRVFGDAWMDQFAGKKERAPPAHQR
jgi:hypothetical protein